MSRRIEAAFLKAKGEGRAALIPYITAGYPDLARLSSLIRALSQAGADVIEIGIPFSDPLADGPVLQRAATEALRQGVRIRDIMAAVREVASGSPPLVFLTYINPVFRAGMGAFAHAARESGVEALIIPDLPWVEGTDLRRAASAEEMTIIPLVAPTSTPQHLRAIRRARGFVYGVSVTGVTGMRQDVDDGARAMVARVKHVVPLPVALGFGISTPDQAREVGGWADGVIVGSALVKAIAEDPGNAEAVAFGMVSAFRQKMAAPSRTTPPAFVGGSQK